MSIETLAAPETLARALEPAAVDINELRRDYGPFLQLVRLIIGVVPNCDSLLAIWPTGFRTYNLLVPNLLNLPFSVWGFGPPAVPLGLALYAASRTARCDYCTAHTCSFALRRGALPEKLSGGRTAAEDAAVAVAEALSRVPADLTPEQKAELNRQFSAADAERIALGVALMGFLNKFMDALGVDLEDAAVQEVSEALLPTGWSTGKHQVRSTSHKNPALQPRPGGPDTLAAKLALLPHLPAALGRERAWTRGVPARWPEVGRYLKAQTGHDFPLLAKLRSRRAARALATVLRDNLNESESALGLPLKALCGLVYASVVGSETLAREARALAARKGPPLPAETFEAIARFGADPLDGSDRGLEHALARLAALPGLPGKSRESALALLLARAVSPSPATVPAPLLARIAETLSPTAQIELVTWISVQQMLHRLGSFLAV